MAASTVTLLVGAFSQRYQRCARVRDRLDGTTSGDARVFLVSLAFLAAAGFLGLHALATPGVLLPGTNTGFALATPVGLLVAAGFAAASSLSFTESQARKVVRHGSWLLCALVVAMVSWGVVSIGAIGLFEHAHGVEEASAPLVVLSAFGFLLYTIAVV